MTLGELAVDALPKELGADRGQLLVDLGRLSLRQSDLRFGQLLRSTANPPGRRPDELTDQLVREGVTAELGRIPDRPPSTGPYWDTVTPGPGSINGRPRDPARIPALLTTLARAWATQSHLSIRQLLEHALNNAGAPENEFGSRWLLIEDVPLRRILASEAATDPAAGEPDDPARSRGS